MICFRFPSILLFLTLEAFRYAADAQFHATLTKLYEEELPYGDETRMLDMMSSWVSHYPTDRYVFLRGFLPHTQASPCVCVSLSPRQVRSLSHTGESLCVCPYPTQRCVLLRVSLSHTQVRPPVCVPIPRKGACFCVCLYPIHRFVVLNAFVF